MHVARVRIQETPWTSMRRGKPKYTEEVILLKEGDTFSLNGLAQHYTFKVLKVDGHAVDIKPIGRSPAPIRRGGSIDLRGGIGRTSLIIGQILEASTPTTDVGTKWRISLQGVESHSSPSQQSSKPAQGRF